MKKPSDEENFLRTPINSRPVGSHSELVRIFDIFRRMLG